MASARDGEVSSSPSDKPPQRPIRCRNGLEAQRLVEHNANVVGRWTSITRLARALQPRHAPSGKVLSGGIDATLCANRPRRFFGRPLAM